MPHAILLPVRQRARPNENWHVAQTRNGTTWHDYEVSTLGRVRRRTSFRHWHAGNAVRQFIKSGYPTVNLRSCGSMRQIYVHELVCVACHGLPEDAALVVRHLDGDKRNNRSANLRWGTSKENGEDAVAHGHSPRGHRHGRPHAKITLEQAAAIKGMLQIGVRNKEISVLYGLSPQNVTNIKKGRTSGFVAPLDAFETERLLKCGRRELARRRLGLLPAR